MTEPPGASKGLSLRERIDAQTAETGHLVLYPADPRPRRGAREPKPWTASNYRQRRDARTATTATEDDPRPRSAQITPDVNRSGPVTSPATRPDLTASDHPGAQRAWSGECGGAGALPGGLGTDCATDLKASSEGTNRRADGGSVGTVASGAPADGGAAPGGPVGLSAEAVEKAQASAQRRAQARIVRALIMDGMRVVLPETHRSVGCGRDHVPIGPDPELKRSTKADGTLGEAFIAHCKRCYDPSNCAECCATVMAHLGQSVSSAVARWAAQGKLALLVTIALPHYVTDDPKALTAALDEIRRRLMTPSGESKRAADAWAAVGYECYVGLMEWMWGERNGHNPHNHLVVFVDMPVYGYNSEAWQAQLGQLEGQLQSLVWGWVAQLLEPPPGDEGVSLIGAEWVDGEVYLRRLKRPGRWCDMRRVLTIEPIYPGRGMAHYLSKIGLEVTGAQSKSGPERGDHVALGHRPGGEPAHGWYAQVGMVGGRGPPGVPLRQGAGAVPGRVQGPPFRPPWRRFLAGDAARGARDGLSGHRGRRPTAEGGGQGPATGGRLGPGPGAGHGHGRRVRGRRRRAGRGDGRDGDHGPLRGVDAGGRVRRGGPLGGRRPARAAPVVGQGSRAVILELVEREGELMALRIFARLVGHPSRQAALYRDAHGVLVLTRELREHWPPGSVWVDPDPAAGEVAA